MASSSSSAVPRHVRSSTYPPKTNPIIVKIEQQLNHLRASESASTSSLHSISIGFNGLAGLYKCVSDALTFFPHHSTETQVNQLVDSSSKLQDVCNESQKELIKLIEAVVALRLSEEKQIEVSRYFSARKEIARSAKSLALRLTEVESELISEDRELSQEESEMARVFRCVTIINISVIESLLKLLSSKPPKTSGFSRFSKLLVGRSTKKVQELLGGKGIEVRDVDVVLHAVFLRAEGDEEKMMIVQKRLEELEEGLRGIKKGLSCIASQLAKTRASLIKHGFLHSKFRI